MGVASFSEELISPIPAGRLFKALVLDSSNLIPQLLPQFVKSIDVHGDGGAGTIEQMNFTEACPFKYVKQRTDELDKENYICKYSIIEGDPLGAKLESISHELRFQDSNGGCVVHVTSKYHTAGNFVISEEEIQEGKDTAKGVYKAVEAHLLDNPTAYA